MYIQDQSWHPAAQLLLSTCKTHAGPYCLLGRGWCRQVPQAMAVFRALIFDVMLLSYNLGTPPFHPPTRLIFILPFLAPETPEIGSLCQ